MHTEMTQITRESFEKATEERLTVQDAVAFLEKEAKARSLRSKIEKFSKGGDLNRLLVTGLLRHHPDMKKDSVERRVRGWLKPDSGRSIRKQDAIEVAFILGLTVEEADEFVALVSEERLHWRNPDEIVYIFALKNGMTYPEAVSLEKEVSGSLAAAGDSTELSQDSFTPIIRSELSGLNTVEELKDYLQHAAGRLGRCHNNAYQMFMEMLDTLENPVTDEVERDMFGEEHLTIRDILRDYFYGENVLYARERARRTKKGKAAGQEQLVLTRIQESIADSWPDETTISKMKARKMDVTRKILILLFLATDSGWDDADEDYEPTVNEVFEDLYRRLNDMLTLCGFSALDPRAPFDWLILYCICVPDMLDLDERMRGVFQEMFGGNGFQEARERHDTL